MGRKSKINKCILNLFVGLLILYGVEILGFMFSAGISYFISSKPLAIILNSTFYILVASFCVLLYAKKIRLPLFNNKIRLVTWAVFVILFPIVWTFISFLIVNGKGHWEAGWENKSQLIDNLLIIFFDKGLGAGIVEELIFRGLMMYSIEAVSNRKRAVFISSIIFTLLHIAAFRDTSILFLLDLTATFSISLFISVMVYRSGTLIVGMLSHAVINVVNCCFHMENIGNMPTIYRYVSIENNEVYVSIINTIVIIVSCISVILIGSKNKICNINYSQS